MNFVITGESWSWPESEWEGQEKSNVENIHSRKPLWWFSHYFKPPTPPAPAYIWERGLNINGILVGLRQVGNGERKPCSQHGGLHLTEKQFQPLHFSGGEGQGEVIFTCRPCAGCRYMNYLISQFDSDRKHKERTISTCALLKKMRSFRKAAGLDGIRYSEPWAGMMGLMRGKWAVSGNEWL